MTVKALARKLIAYSVGRFGYDLVARPEARDFPYDFSEHEKDVYLRVCNYTMTGKDSLVSFVRAVEHAVRHAIPGAIVECGVWRGGSMMAAALTLQRLGEARELWLYDTFEGMPAGSEHDFNWKGESATQRANDVGRDWARASIEDVKRAMESTGCRNFRCIVGKVEATIPATVPDQIAVLRLDTDFYESTKHELTHLYPRVSPGGIIFVDDYGHWMGSKKAVDEFRRMHPVHLFRINDAVRAFVKA